MKRLELIGLEDLGEICSGDSIGRLICDACSRQETHLKDDDVVVIAQKIVSKAEGQVVHLDNIQPSPRAVELARQLDKEPALVEIILRESRSIVRMGGRALIVETHHGFICANSGVDQSNVGMRQVTLLPKEPDGSAREIRTEIHRQTGKSPAVIISDSFGRPWRVGTVDVAIGIAGLKPIKDERGTITGLGDMALIGRFSLIQKVKMKYSLSINLLAGAKFPTGDTARLDDEVQIAKDEGHGAIGGVHEHDLTLGSGSFDGRGGGAGDGKERRSSGGHCSRLRDTKGGRVG